MSTTVLWLRSERRRTRQAVEAGVGAALRLGARGVLVRPPFQAYVVLSFSSSA